MSDYPLPSYAAHIWITGDEINLAFPSPLDARSHTVKFPATNRGLTLALHLLRQRERDGVTNTIAKAGAPTQYQVEEIYKTISYNEKLASLNSKRAVSAEEKAEAEAFLQEIGL